MRLSSFLSLTLGLSVSAIYFGHSTQVWAQTPAAASKTQKQPARKTKQSPSISPASEPAPQPLAQPEPAPAAEPQILIGEVIVTATGGAKVPPEIEKQVFDAVITKPGRTTTGSQIQADINAIFALGFFADVKADLKDTDIGTQVSFLVQLNPVLNAIKTEGITVVERPVVDRIFASQLGKTTNLRDLQAAVKELEKYYQDKGFVLAQVADLRLDPEGNATVVVAEGEIENINVAFLNEEGKTTDKDGNPNRGNTREFIITRELSLKPGDVFNRNRVQADLGKVFGLSLFDDVNVGLNPGSDPKKVILTINVKERNTGSIAAGAGLSSATGLFGTLSFQQANLGGNNQRLGLDIQIGERDLLFDLNFTDPWLAGDPFRTSFTTNIFNRRLFSFVFDNPNNDPTAGVGTNNDNPRENRLGFGFSFSRPLANNITASAGFRYERVTITDANNNTTPFDNGGRPLTTSSNGQDDLFLFQLAAAQDLRNDPLRPTQGSVLRVATEQSVPLGNGSIFFNRLRASYSFYVPVSLLNFAEGPQTFAVNVQGGTVLGTLPPYEAFRIGGSNSVRGWDEGRIGSGRSFALISAEYRFPVFNILGGVLFADYGTDLGSGSSVPGDPGLVRGKPGSGGGYGVGLRIQSPLGAIRIDYGFATNGGTQFSFGIGEKF
ncbi:MAG: BamA/TamA family outer membrane protein [Pseudanabaenaceae cyanobacterium bins.68]|nr:BamA/TamA family outer membrane protein [Pseudanabaenaceae cyanobacterium bins.68]